MQKCPLVQSAFLSGFWTDLRHQYGIFGGESQTSLFPLRSSLRDVNERRLYSQARIIPDEELQYSGSFCSTGYAGSNTVMSSFSKMSVFTVHMKTQKCHFQKFQVWRALFKGCVFSHCLRRICVGGRPICKEKLHFQTKTCGRASSPSTVILA